MRRVVYSRAAIMYLRCYEVGIANSYSIERDTKFCGNNSNSNNNNNSLFFELCTAPKKNISGQKFLNSSQKSGRDEKSENNFKADSRGGASPFFRALAEPELL